MTLVELIISMIIVSVMMVSILTASVTLQSVNKSDVIGASMVMRTEALADMIRQDAARVVGSGSNVGVCINDVTTEDNYICFRQATGSQTTQWVCYTRLFYSADHAECNLVNVHRCVRTDNGASTGGAPMGCDLAVGLTACLAGDSEFVGTMVSPGNKNWGDWGPCSGDTSMPPPSFSITNGFSMTVVNRMNPQSSRGNDSGWFMNPEVSFTVSAYPEGHSW